MLKLNQITVKFGGLLANNDISLEIQKGDLFGLIGPNGAGKTTLFNVISGVIEPTKGEVIFDGRKINGLKPYQINKLGIARTFQNINLFKDMTVLENVMVGRHCRTDAGVYSSIFRLPKHKRNEEEITEKSLEFLKFLDLSKFTDMKASSLSYGQQRRLEIARALATEPKLILLDEPAAGMNASEKKELSETIQRILDTGITVILVEHDMKVVLGISHKIAVLNYGKMICFGTPGQVQANEEVVAAYLGGSHNG